MKTFKVSALILAGSAGLLTAPAFAADMPEFVEPAPVVVREFGGWYLRGDVGISNQRVEDFSSPLFTAGGNDFDLQYSEFDASAFLGVGVGYRFSEWIRADITGEYRFDSDFRGLDYYFDDGEIAGANVYDGEKSEIVALLNGYIDGPKFGMMRPFVGAGVGAARVSIKNFSDFNPVTDALGLSGDTDTWNFAWALYAGASFEVTPRWTFEVAYRYLNMGDAETEDLVGPDGSDELVNPYNFDNIHSHDVKLGMRYSFN
jgi:opacity protein-like surface antigen